MSDARTVVEREFAGALRQFQLPPANRSKLYRGVETIEHGTIPEMAIRASRNALGAATVAHILSHALSGGHPIVLLRMRDLVADAMRGRPLSEFLPLAVDILAAAYAGNE